MRSKCCKCETVFEYKEEDVRIDYKGTDYDTRLVRCPFCGAINIVGYVENIDRDEWYYE